MSELSIDKKYYIEARTDLSKLWEKYQALMTKSHKLRNYYSTEDLSTDDEILLSLKIKEVKAMMEEVNLKMDKRKARFFDYFEDNKKEPYANE